MPRGFTWAVYEDDFGRLFALRVDADSVADPSRGWQVLGVEQTLPFPRGWQPRLVLGIDETGHNQRTRIGSLGAALWTGAASTWRVEASDGTIATATVVARVGERHEPTPPLESSDDARAHQAGDAA